MKKRQFFEHALAWGMVLLMALPPGAFAQQSGGPPVFNQEQLDQILAPIALYPDPLVSQILMASTYPLEVVQADRWAKQNSKLKGDALTKALETQDWDPSVKSLVNFPQVLTMMSEKVDLTQKMGDAFLADQKKVLDTIQSLRAKAQAAGNLKTTTEQKVIVEEKIIKIEPANPQVIYVPTYNPAVVYGVWPYPAYPPYSYYPPGYVWATPFAFAAGVGLGMAWGYAWGSCNWRGGSVHYNYNQNININRNINRNRYAQGGQGNWQHNAEHRRGVSYRDQGTAQRYNRAGTNEAIKSREQFRGRAEQGRQELARGGAGERGGQGLGGDRGGASKGSGAGDRGGAGSRPGAGAGDRGGASQLGGGGRAGTADRGGAGGASQLGGGGSRGGAFEGVDRGGSSARSASQRGSSSMGSFGGGGGSRPSGGGGGGARGGGGGGGGRRR
jgi:hypothetical protein